MPTLSRDAATGEYVAMDDPFVALADDEAPSIDARALLVSFARFQADGDAWLSEGLRVGVRLKADEPVEGLAYDLLRLALVALEFPKFRDGRAYSSAALLRSRYGFTGDLRAVGEVVRDQAFQMVRCGFTSFEPADGSTPEQWAASANRFRHVYQAAEDRRPPAFRERTGEP